MCRVCDLPVAQVVKNAKQSQARKARPGATGTFFWGPGFNNSLGPKIWPIAILWLWQIMVMVVMPRSWRR